MTELTDENSTLQAQFNVARRQEVLRGTIKILEGLISRGLCDMGTLTDIAAKIFRALDAASSDGQGWAETVVEKTVDKGWPNEPKTKAEIKASIGKDFLTSFEDGKRYKALKRHLTKLGLTPDDYRAKWGLPADYPMVAPNYSARRSELAKQNGLGRK